MTGTDTTPTKDASEKQGWLTNPRAVMLAAVLTVIGGLLGALITAWVTLRADAHSTTSAALPTVSIATPVDDSLTGPILTVSGTASNLKGGQTVWVYVQSVSPTETPSTRFYLAYGPCPVGQNHIWTCNAEAGRRIADFGCQYKIWAAITPDTQARVDAQKESLPSGQNYIDYGGTRPPHSTGNPGVAPRLVTRYPRLGRTCPGY
jgi:hypothetical protein